MKIAKFSDPASVYPIEYILQRADDELECEAAGGDVRITEWADVTWTPRKPEEIVPAQLAQLDEAERELRLELQEKLDAIAERRGQLLALTHEVQS